MSKPRVFSGVQPTGELHLGNYLGAIKNWVALQDGHECIFCVVDLHAITGGHDPQTLRRSVLATATAYIACGVDPSRSVIFQQSKIGYHAELQWLLSSVTRLGWLNRMTQFKTKAGFSAKDRLDRLIEAGFRAQDELRALFPHGCTIRDDNPLLTVESETDLDVLRQRNAMAVLEGFENGQADGIGAGLYLYPVLMAADILLYKATHVPVGEDQVQHLQLARQIARAFNGKYGDLFPEPQPIVNPMGARIMSLRYPDRKMSKSNMESPEEVIFLTDTADQIAKKIKRATTDPDMLPSEAAGLQGRLGATNLVTIYALLRDIGLDNACAHFGGKGFGAVKRDLTEALTETIVPIGQRMREIDVATVKTHLAHGADDALFIAEATMREVYEAMGLG